MDFLWQGPLVQSSEERWDQWQVARSLLNPQQNEERPWATYLKASGWQANSLWQ